MVAFSFRSCVRFIYTQKSFWEQSFGDCSEILWIEFKRFEKFDKCCKKFDESLTKFDEISKKFDKSYKKFEKSFKKFVESFKTFDESFKKFQNLSESFLKASINAFKSFQSSLISKYWKFLIYFKTLNRLKSQLTASTRSFMNLTL